MTNARWFQMFRLDGQHIVNEKGKVLNIAEGHDNEGQALTVDDKRDELS